MVVNWKARHTLLMPCTICILVSAVVAGRQRFDSHKVFNVYPTTKDQIIQLVKLENGTDYVQADFWTGIALNRNVSLYVPPEEVGKFTDLMTQAGMDVHVYINNIQALIDAESASMDSDNILQTFPSYDEINSWLQTKANENPDVLGYYYYGTTTAGRPMYAYKLGAGGFTNPSIFIEVGIHAREWITEATVLNCINKWLIEYNANEQAIRDLLDYFNIYIVPCANPDGYEYSRDTFRMWRKNRENHNHMCTGVDLNRNFDYGFGGASTSDNPCSDIYRGGSAFSERETQQLADFISFIKNIFGQPWEMYLSIHSFSQLILTPWGFTNELRPDDAGEIDSMADLAARVIKDATDTTFIVGTPGDVLYSVGGSSMDWAKKEAGFKYSYTFELRPDGYPYFIVPTSYIQPSSKEIYAAFNAMFAELKSRLSNE